MGVDGAGEMVSFSITGLDQGAYPPFVAGQTAGGFMLLARLAGRFLIHLFERLRSLENFAVISKVGMVSGVKLTSPTVFFYVGRRSRLIGWIVLGAAMSQQVRWCDDPFLKSSVENNRDIQSRSEK